MLSLVCAVHSSHIQKKCDCQRTESVTLGEVKHRVSFWIKGGKASLIIFWKKMHLPILADLPSVRPGDLSRLKTAVMISAFKGLD